MSERIFIQFGTGGECEPYGDLRIRKWGVEPFVGGAEYVLATPAPVPTEGNPVTTIQLSEEAIALYQKLAARPLGMGYPWRVEGDSGKPLLYGCQSLLAYGTIGKWSEFRMIAALVNGLSGKVPAAHYDDLAVDRFSGFMKRKLARKREEGRGGWQDPAQCSIEELSALLIEHVQKGDPLDVANLAMMIHHRDGRITNPDKGEPA